MPYIILYDEFSRSKAFFANFFTLTTRVADLDPPPKLFSAAKVGFSAVSRDSADSRSAQNKKLRLLYLSLCSG